MKKKSKRFKEILKTKIIDKKIVAKDILDLVKKNSTTKFDESIDVSLRINLKQSKGGDLSLRTARSLQLFVISALIELGYNVTTL